MAIDLDVSLRQLRSRRGEKWNAYEPDVLPAWVADMDFPVADPIRQAIARTVERGDLGYPAEASHRELAQVFTGRMGQRYGWQPDPDMVRPAGNLIQALIASTATFSRAGEGVLIQTPIYHPFLKIVEALGRKLAESPLPRGASGYGIDIPGMRQAAVNGPRLLLFCNPHNPTGRVFLRGELEDIAAIAVDHDLVVVSDEVHADLAYPGQRHIPLASLGPEIASRTITITSATKAFNIAGLKCALMHFGSERLLNEQTSFFNEHVLGTPNILGIEATLAAWRDGDEWLLAVMQRLEENRKYVSGFLARQLPQVTCHPPQAGYLAWLDCAELDLPSRPYEYFLSRARVAFSDGGIFSERSEDFVRLNFATAPAILQQILERCAEAVRGR